MIHNPLLYTILTKPYQKRYQISINGEIYKRLDLKVQSVCEHLEINISDLLSAKRDRKYTWPRFYIMNFMRESLSMPLVKIGYFFKRDHSTAIYNIQQHNDLLLYDKKYKKFVEGLP